MFQGPWRGAEPNPLGWSIPRPGVSSRSQHHHACQVYLQGLGSARCDLIHFGCNLKMLQGILRAWASMSIPSSLPPWYLGHRYLQQFSGLVEDELSGVKSKQAAAKRTELNR